eukprot:CAMPEP_0198288322 /NCGR_PEP_ID=MMETSP1449-20131203/6858_1 /TAXON_ID=420275 /ORGANISM="Attheya septentrionalis, Strain CCMP2084" /LENGTH=835 /DNA_ID=CAMNT_0043986435 /DNA_START=192 /DNA_END=2699 /DNA_ORIENTATION=+
MGKGMVSLSCTASVFMALYMGMAIFNLYRLMNPITFLDVSSFPPSRFVKPLWDTEAPLHMQVYLSSVPKFDLSFLKADPSLRIVSSSSSSPHDDSQDDERDQEQTNVQLLWDTYIQSASLAKSFLITTLDCSTDDPEQDSTESSTAGGSSCAADASYQYANQWLNEAEREHHQQNAVDGGIVSALSSNSGDGMESTSVLLTLYGFISKQASRCLSFLGMLSSSDESLHTDTDTEPSLSSSTRRIPTTDNERTVIQLSKASPLWTAMGTNETWHIHVILTRSMDETNNDDIDAVKTFTYEEAARSLMKAQRSHSLLLGHVNLIKYEAPHHIQKPRRLLFQDVQYIWRKYVTRTIGDDGEPAPWDTAGSNPEAHDMYQRALQMKQDKVGYPYFKPEVAVKFVYDDVEYPDEFAHLSGMDLVKLDRPSVKHPTGVAYLPGMHVDEIGLTSEKYIPANATLTSLPLRISFDRSDTFDTTTKQTNTATAGGISPARWRLLSHLSATLDSQKSLGFESSDIDDLRRLIADTNVTLLLITILASALHLLFEFLTFKNEVTFWNRNTDLTGLSVRSLFLDMISQVILVMYLVEKDSSLLMTIPAACGCAIALWKCQRGAGFQFVRITANNNNNATGSCSWWNVLPRLMGYELRATRLEAMTTTTTTSAATESRNQSTPSRDNLRALTMETDRIATSTLGSVMLPIVMIYTMYSFFREEHFGWYSWWITCASSAVYALGFVLMTPQLFLNYKLHSVAHLPWRVLVYKFINTFIDDLFAFIIRMPTMARISCFRDDIVFIVYLYQRWLYPVDTSRPVEGGDGPTNTVVPTSDKDEVILSDKKKKQ